MDRKEICTVRGGLATVALLVTMLAGAAHAAPAPWYWWVSKVDGQRVCAQHMPAQGWERGQGPYTNAQCRK